MKALIPRLNRPRIHLGARRLTFVGFTLLALASASALALRDSAWALIIGGLAVFFLIAVVRQYVSLQKFLRMREQDLELSSHRWQFMAETFPGLLVYCELDGRIAEIHQTGPRLLRVLNLVKAGENIESVLTRAFGASGSDLVMRMILETAEAEPKPHSLDLETLSGERCRLELWCRLDRDGEGLPIGHVVALHEVGDKKALADRQNLFVKLGSVLNASLDFDTTLSHLASIVVPEFADSSAIDIMSRNGEVIRSAVAGDVALFAESDEDHGKTSARVEEALLSGEARIFSGDSGRSILIIPLKARHRILGAMVFAIQSSQRTYSEDDLNFAVQLGRQAALAIDNAQLYRESQALIRIKDEFLASLSHELRTPMNVILGWLELLQDTQLPQATQQIEPAYNTLDSRTYRDALAALGRNARLQIRLINDLLDVSGIVSGQFALLPEAINLDKMVEEELEQVRLYVQGRAIQIHMTTDSDLQSMPIFADPDRIRQAIWNVLSNAVKFSRDGGTVHVRLESFENHFQMVVEDDGAGIDPHFLPHVFDCFRQEDGTLTRSAGGLGVGLSLVRHIVVLHGGDIRIESEGRGRGSRVIVILPKSFGQVPTAKEPQMEVSLESIESRSSRANLLGTHILLVDDSPDVLHLVAKILSRAGARVTTASSAAEALQLFERERPQLIISDIGMPGEDGLSLIRRVRMLEEQLGLEWTPSVALTAYAQPSDRMRSLEAGFDLHLTKPVSSARLLEVATTLAEEVRILASRPGNLVHQGAESARRLARGRFERISRNFLKAWS